jgi:DeoR family suf operon transcriptional repressor
MGTYLSDPQPDMPLPSAYRGPRGAILLELKRGQQVTAKDLGEKLGISLNAVRHHVRELEVEGLIVHRREQRGVGAPTFTYHLSAAGEALFPQRYKEMLTQLLDRVAESTGRAAVVSALEDRFAELSRKLQAELADAPPSRRMEVVMKTLVDGGFMAEWAVAEGDFRLTEHNCAIRAVAERFPEICAAEAKFLQEVLEAVVERQAHILEGCTACEYQVRFVPTGPVPLTALQRGGSSRVPEEQV